MVRSSTAIIIPAFNEEKNIGSVILNAKKFGDVIVIDDFSQDKTKIIAQNLGAKVISHNLNQGYVKALNTGFSFASSLNYDFLITLDADGQHDPDMLFCFKQALENGAECVLGYRDQKQRFSEVLFSVFTKAKWGIFDPLCGMKGYKLDLYLELGYFDKHNLIGTELMLFAAKNRSEIIQVPVKQRSRLGKSRFGGSFSGNFKILKALLKFIFV